VDFWAVLLGILPKEQLFFSGSSREESAEVSFREAFLFIYLSMKEKVGLSFRVGFYLYLSKNLKSGKSKMEVLI
jgi:hypothetical protein